MPAERFNSRASALQLVRARPASDAAQAIDSDRILDAARALLLEEGLPRMTMTAIADRAGVSRATLYRRWENVTGIVADVSTREWNRLTERAASRAGGTAREKVVSTVVHVVREMRSHPLLRVLIDESPEFLTPYQVRRQGRVTAFHLVVIEDVVRQGFEDGSIRSGDAVAIAQAVVLMSWSFVTTAPAIVGSPDAVGPELDALDTELTLALDRYLAP
ncbi:TetR/AcrR family transcriptional regulator [Aeromicrobium phragmitis]|uniref:TetR/AcrR family transcriptional regulator n=1 Tax=Aeromicrobium phragmitis TaxID=2478914 RepID=A0A3L8PK16_9ACTN|nr:TetR/AcrR family transcriptional regulator [Aeromicrobium phragmitis]RLV55053.1 TetR/AcrR family transcriptional regulator [Aeromicrobium phragmitis]